MNRNELLALARARHRAATRKISRQRAAGVDVSGSEFDPRRNLKTVARYNRRQLEGYIRTLNTFTDRRNQYVAGAGGSPIARSTFSQLQQLQDEARERARSRFADMRGIRQPSGMTGDNVVAMRPGGRHMREFNSSVPEQMSDFSPGDIRGERGARALIRSLQTRPRRRKSNVKRLRETIQRDNEWSGNNFDVSSLTDRQLEFLVSYTPFMASFVIASSGPRDLLGNDHDIALEVMIQDNERMAQQLIDWARNQLPE